MGRKIRERIVLNMCRPFGDQITRAFYSGKRKIPVGKPLSNGGLQNLSERKERVRIWITSESKELESII
ncbi:hypothetical protein EHQ27_10155 [Leptospira wolffii]|nr:hypothetical protein EHQ32_14375 [Leptospira wolffii]TGK71647.1 hypothetical protein EHQ27_10155 [Leptospira wolffii]TGK75496.1 hypothetical protein EHQ35_03750 [Leptospira wolffii]TGL33014.1 hypothetical protein EHQ57_00780 [Leptospira wolffii]